jgi:hypothetical protein
VSAVPSTAAEDRRQIFDSTERGARGGAAAGADEVRTFRPGSLDEIRSVTGAVRDPLRSLIGDVSLAGARVGYEHGEVSQPVTYAAMHFYGGKLPDLLNEVCNPARYCR